jgi:hypothetical protein
MIKPIVCAALLLIVLAHPVTSLIEDDLITGLIGSGDVFNGSDSGIYVTRLGRNKDC